MAGYMNEMLDRCVGQQVVIKQLTAPEFDEALADAINADPMITERGPLWSRTAV